MLFVDLICQVQDHRKKQKISPEWLFSVVLQREPYFTEIKDEVVYSKLGTIFFALNYNIWPNIKCIFKELLMRTPVNPPQVVLAPNEIKQIQTFVPEVTTIYNQRRKKILLSPKVEWPKLNQR